ncbi:MAG: hypothetical protein KAJ19_24600, partial [Gammaproteobacteria bacterium]|nr:hypothetical protein [Gammaproteobacteria bacterium]
QFVQRFKMESGLAPRYDDLNTFGEGLERLVEFSREHPIDMAQFITAHFLHNEISTLLTLPASYPLVENINTYINLLPYWESKGGKLWSQCCSLEANIDQLSYWGEWDGKLVSQSNVPVLVNLILISIGLGVSWKLGRFVGLYPLFIHMLYSLSSAVWGISGWRFILPVDWIGIYYFCVGLVYLLLLAFTFFTGKEHRYAKQEEQPEQYIKFLRNRGWILAIIVLGIGLLVPVVELVIPQRYTQLTKREAVVILEEKLTMWQKEYDIDSTAILEDTTIEAYVGRGLYPRFYQAGEGEPGTSYRWPAHTERDYSRLGFYLAGPANWSVVLPLDDTPQFFPNAQDVLVFGCRVENYLIAQVIVLLNTPGMIYESSIPCSSFEK